MIWRGWPPATGAGSYAVIRATLSELRTGSYGNYVVPTQPGTTHDDDEIPVPGQGFGYLIRGISTACGIGTLGAGPGGVERIQAASTLSRHPQ